MFNLGLGEIVIIAIVLILVVGPERLPSVMKNVGKALRTVRQASREIQSTVGMDELWRDEDLLRPQPPRTPPPATVSRQAELGPSSAAAASATPPQDAAPAAPVDAPVASAPVTTAPVASAPVTSAPPVTAPAPADAAAPANPHDPGDAKGES